jgi:Flp pilus assembly protein TadG
LVKAERGAAMVEMAAVTLFLVLLVMGIVDLGRVIFTNISIRDAVQEGASYAAYTEDTTSDDIEDRIRTAVSSPDLTGATIALYCSPDPRNRQDGTRVRVEMTYDVSLITPIVGSMLGGTITLRPNAEVDRFYADCPAGVDDPILGP